MKKLKKINSIKTIAKHLKSRNQLLASKQLKALKGGNGTHQDEYLPAAEGIIEDDSML